MYALITGATSGIGKECAKILGRLGYNLILVGRRKERLAYMKEYFSYKYGTNVICYDMDLSSVDKCIELYKKTKKYDITILINSAGFGKAGYVTDTNVKDDIDMINTNITAVHVLTKLFGRHMKSGNIMNIASIAAFFPGPYMAEYGATKAYVLRLGVAMNYELKCQNKPVYITTVCPGPVDTEFDKVSGCDFAMGAISARRCAKIAIRGMLKNKSVVVPTAKIKIISKLSGIVPDKIILPIEYYIQTKKIKNKCIK